MVLQAWCKRDHKTYHGIYETIIQELVGSRQIVWDKAHGVLDKDFLVRPDSDPKVRVSESNDRAIPDVRQVEQLPPSEIQLAISNFIEDAGGPVQRDELICILVKMYGWRRRTQNRLRVFNKAIDGMVEEKILEETDEGFHTQ